MSGDGPSHEREWPLLAVSAFLLVVSGVRGQIDGIADPLVASMLTAGLIAFGAWIAMEVRKK